jgi:hypothetical protein
MAKEVYGSHARVYEWQVPRMRTEGKEFHLRVSETPFPAALTDDRLLVCHPDRAVARRMLKAALEVAL